MTGCHAHGTNNLKIWSRLLAWLTEPLINPCRVIIAGAGVT